MISACAIIASNYLPFIRVLADSFFAHHVSGSLTVLVIDDEQRQLNPDDTRIDWRRLNDIGFEPAEIHRLAGIYDVTELATAVKPVLLRRLLDEGRDHVIFLDPDIRIYDSLADTAQLAERFGIVLTPHTMAPFPKDRHQVNDLFVLAAGVYNLGFIAVGERARPFLDWWWQSTRREALIDVQRMMFTDQRWVDYVPSLFDHYLLKDPGYNVAYWNLHGRSVEANGDRYLVDGAPLRFFHFSGFDVRKPWLLSRHQGEQPRVLLSERPALARLCAEYGVCLREAGLEADVAAAYGWSTTAAGLTLTGRIRRLYWQALVTAEARGLAEPPDPFDAERPDRFVAWLNTPAEEGPRRVSRYLYTIYRSRIDLQVAFPDIYGGDAARFAEWVVQEGASQEQIAPALVGGVSAASSPGHVPPTFGAGLTIAGYFRSELGMGEAARLLAQAADAAHIPHATTTLEASLSRQQQPFNDRPAGEHPYDINVLCVNADCTSRFAKDAGPEFFAGRHTIGYWFWEVDPLPAAMHGAFDYVDEVWAATDYVADILRTAGRKPVFTVPLPIPTPRYPATITRAQLGLPDRFTFLLLFDFLSVFERKNPLGLIAAFTSAFAPNEGPVLVIKSINGDRRLAELEEVRMTVAGRPDIVLLDCYFSADEKNALLGLCDCYVSLHRSEGLGLSMAEAMTLGKPIIATGYSGNLHFMTEENSFLVDYTMVDIPPGCGPYPERAQWAEPSQHHAAALMRNVYERPLDAAQKARRGQADIRERHGIQAAAAALTQRLDAIRLARRQAPVVPQPEPLRLVDAPGAAAVPVPTPMPPAPLMVSFETVVPQLELLAEPRVSVEGRRWPVLRRAALRTLFRLIRPYWFQQRQFQNGLIGAVLASARELAAAVTTLAISEHELRHQTDARLNQLAGALADTQRVVAAMSARSSHTTDRHDSEQRVTPIAAPPRPPNGAPPSRAAATAGDHLRVNFPS